MKTVFLLLLIMLSLNLICTEVRAQGGLVPSEKEGKWGYREESEWKKELIDEGYIVVGGGCEVYHTGKIVFRPKKRDDGGKS
jgi:hypothetical protein